MKFFSIASFALLFLSCTKEDAPPNATTVSGTFSYKLSSLTLHGDIQRFATSRIGASTYLIIGGIDIDNRDSIEVYIKMPSTSIVQGVFNSAYDNNYVAAMSKSPNDTLYFITRPSVAEIFFTITSYSENNGQKKLSANFSGEMVSKDDPTRIHPVINGVLQCTSD